MRRKVKTDMREFIDCYIAFLDLLGFKALLKEKRNDLCEYIAGLFDRIQEDWYITVNKTGEYLIDPALHHVAHLIRRPGGQIRINLHGRAEPAALVHINGHKHLVLRLHPAGLLVVGK